MDGNPFCGQSVIVTGASAGIGRALALRLAGQGARVALAARRADRLEQLAAECRALLAETLVLPTDVSSEAQCKALVEATVGAFGGLDMLINNAGMAASALFDEFPDLSLFKQTVNINLYGPIYATYYALPHLKRAGGRIVAVSSLGGKMAMPFNTPYCTSKYGLHGFYESLRAEVTKQGVSVTVICPWWVATEFHEAQLDKSGVARGPKGRVYYTKRTMTADRCAQITLDAAFKRRREVLMGPGVLGLWIKLLAPGFLDWLTVKIFLEPIIRRAKAGKIEV